MSEKLFESILDKVNFSLAEHRMIYDDSGTPIDYEFIYVNDLFCSNVSLSRNEVIGKTVRDLFPLTEEFWIKTYGEVVQTGKAKEFVHYSVHFEKYYEVLSYKTREDHFVSTFVEIRDYENDGKAISNDRELLRTFATSSKAAFFEFDVLGKSFKYSDNLEEIIGRKNISFDNYLSEFIRLTHPGDFRKVMKLNKNIMTGKMNEITIEMRFYNEEKQDYIWMSFFAYVDKRLKFLPVSIKGIAKDITEEKEREIELEESNQLFEQAKQVANIVTFLYYSETQTFEANKELSSFLGIEDVVNLEEYRRVLHPEDIKTFDEATEYIKSNPEGKVTHFRIIKDNKIKHIQSSVYGTKNELGEVGKVFGILKDITEIEESRLRVEQSRKSFMQIFESSPAGIFICNEYCKISISNKVFQEYTGKENITLSEFLGDSYYEIKQEMLNGGVINDIQINYIINDEIKNYRLSITPMHEGNISRYQGTVIDITDQVKKTEEIKFLATRDILTKVYNRNYFEEFTNKIPQKQEFGLVICDIDGLKLINDAFGHLEGDKLLIQFAAHLNKSFSSDIVARLGGDEFAILSFGKTEDDLEAYERIIKEYIQNLFMFGISIDVSIGYALKCEKCTFEDSFKRAENLMYRRKLTERSSRKSKSLDTIMETLHERTEETKEHCSRVGNYAVGLLKLFGHKRLHELEAIRLESSVHDIGKIAINDAIISSPNKLTEEEYEQVKYHSESGYKIVTNIIENEEIAIAVLYHHERWDGKGYPHNLEKEQIPLYARIISICDAFDTMISGRRYRSAISITDAKAELVRCSGTQFDPKLVDLFIQYLEK